jgi:hypothetical protein
MEADKNKPKTTGIEPGVTEGTKEMGYWEFKKEFCDDKGWQLRRIDPQTYVVIDSKHVKIGIFKSGEGYFPNPEAVKDTEAPPE